MNFMKGPKQFILPIYQQRLTTISLLLAAFDRALFLFQSWRPVIGRMFKGSL
jgi:hypothetical protein